MRRSRYVPLLVLLAVSCADADGTQATTDGCDLKDCGPSFAVDFDPDGLFVEGTYRVEAMLDGELHVCEGTIPLDCAKEACPDTSAITLRQDGCNLGVPAQAVSAVEMWVDASEVSVQVLLDGAGYGAAAYTPVYETTMPGGEMCAQECRVAPRETLVIGPE